MDPFKATGKPHTLWVAFAKFYEDNGQLDDARIILEKATKVSFKQVDDLASVWCECGELELRHENYDQALRLLRVSIGGRGVGWTGLGAAGCAVRVPEAP